MPDVLEYQDFRIQWVHGHGDATLRAQLIGFWLAQGAIVDPFQAWQRSFEAACVVRNGVGELVGVSTAYTEFAPRLGAAYWFLRAFMRPDSRQVGLTSRLLEMTFNQLRQAYHGEPHAPLGLIMFVENTKLMGPAPSRGLERRGYVHLGSDAQGRAVWHRLFDTPVPAAKG